MEKLADEIVALTLAGVADVDEHEKTHVSLLLVNPGDFEPILIDKDAQRLRRG
ncbi:hypothetical protein [Trueperella sp.]|uniref:hypothetical protein n=1 Tax=Trueperella sp. TaxID=2699835 RepID=UPI003734E37F